MTWITFLWPMATAACITMGLIHLRIGLRRKPGAAHLLFAFTAFVFAAFSGVELSLLLARSPARFLELQRWSDLIGAVGVVSLAVFVSVFFGTGRKWLALLGSGLLLGSLSLNLSPEPKLVFLHLTGIRTVETFGGASYAVAEGTRDPWVAVFYLGVLLIAVFVADASVTLWRRGGRRRAAMVGGATTFFLVIGGVQTSLVDAGILTTPYLVSFFYVAILAAMATELSDEVLRASQLAQDLQESEQRLQVAAEAARSLSGRLIHAQEAERTRLARELHDDLNQSLALLAVELDLFGQNPPADGSAVTGRMQEFSALVKNLSSDVHQLSHELHPAKLEQLGLVSALRGFCRELGTAHQIAIEFEPGEFPRSLPDDISLCLYRIVQESLQNVVKHSGANGAKVELTADEKELCLAVSDHGCGFDAAKKTG
jgi:signal transduction histidine kinase